MSSLIKRSSPLGAGRSAQSIALPDGQFGKTTQKGWMKQPCGHTNISDAIVIESMGALFMLNRLMMEELNEDAYQTIDRSRLFKLCDSMDETETSIHYGSSGFPLQSIREAPHARI